MSESAPSPAIGFGIVGTGMIAGFHAQAIAHSQGGRLVGVMGRNVETVPAFGRTHGALLATTDLAEMLARPDIHVVCITTPSGAHSAPALAAIRAGKHVVIEKPLEITPDRADEIIAAAERAGVRLAPIFQARFGRGAQSVKSAIAAGRLGRLALASADVKWHRAPSYYTGWKGTLAQDGGGAVINQAIHALDLLQWFAGMPSEVFAFKTRRVHAAIEAEDTASASFRFPDGALGGFEATTAAWPGWSRRIELCGEKGSVVLDDDTITRWDFREPESADETIRDVPRQDPLGSGAAAPNAISFLGHQRQIQDLIDALRENRALAIEAREGRNAVVLVDAIYRSANAGKPVSLPRS